MMLFARPKVLSVGSTPSGAVSRARNRSGSDRPQAPRLIAESPPTRSISRRLRPSHSLTGKLCSENIWGVPLSESWMANPAQQVNVSHAQSDHDVNILSE